MAESIPAVIYTLFDMARFPFVTLVLTKKLSAPEVGSVMGLTQSLFFVPSVVIIYELSRIQSVQFGLKDSKFKFSASRRAADSLSINLGIFSSVGLLGYGCFPMHGLGDHQEDLLRKFLFTYAIGTIPTLWVIVRQENLIAVKQAWHLAGLNLLNLGIMGGISYALVDSKLQGWGLGLGFSISSLAALAILEVFLGLNSQHKNRLFQCRGKSFRDSQDVISYSKKLKSKGMHSGIIFAAGYLGFCSTLLVQLYKDPDPANIANGALNQFFYLVTVPGLQLVQSFNSIFIGKVLGEIIDERGKTPRAFKLSQAKKTLNHNLIIISLVSLMWPFLLTLTLRFFKEPALKFLTQGDDATLYPRVLDSFNGALPFVVAGASLDNVRNMLLGAKRTVMKDPPNFDGIFQGAAGVLTFVIVLGIVLGTNPANLADIWRPMFVTNYLVPFLMALFTTGKHFYSLTDETFQSKDFEMNSVVNTAMPGSDGEAPGQEADDDEYTRVQSPPLIGGLLSTGIELPSTPTSRREGAHVVLRPASLPPAGSAPLQPGSSITHDHKGGDF
jgi:hypothetical protein